MAVSRAKCRLILGFSSALIALALYLALGATPTDAHAGHDHASVSGALAASGSCESMGMVSVGDLGLCTHGPDPSPPGVTAAVVDPPVDFATAGAAVCAGDGTSGKRIQVIYARSSDRADRYSTYLHSMRTWASQADTIYQASAQETGGQRYIRFVHDANCTISVANVILSSTGDDNFNSMISELYDQGYNRNDRRYLVYLDSNSSYLCGQGTVWPDDSPGLSNDNNTYYGYAAIYNGCWSDGTTTAHELGHTFGAVQSSAPHYSGYGHCTDEWDVMCYVDGPGVSMTINCAGTDHDARLDCNHDDYFHTNPPSGNYLATHWNIANSGFLGKSLSTLTLSKTQSKYNGEIVATMGGFSPNATITLRWPDGTVLAQTTSDGAGNGTATFRTPLAPLGNYTVRASDASGRSATTMLRVIPRIKLTASSGLAGSTIRVYFYGFSPGDRVQIQWFTTSGSTYRVLNTVTVASTGRASSLVTIPTSATVGSHVIRGKVIGVSRSASTTFNVTGPAIAAEPTATPSATPTATATATPTESPTIAPTVDPTIVETPSPESTIEQSPTPEPTVDPGTPEPVQTATPEPTETPTPEPTATETPTPELVAHLSHDQAVRERWQDVF